MRLFSWIICCVVLWPGLMPPLAFAQEEDVKAREQPVTNASQTPSPTPAGSPIEVSAVSRLPLPQVNVSVNKIVAPIAADSSNNNESAGRSAATAVTPPVPSEGRLARWFELQTATLSFRYRVMENSRGVTTHQHFQHHQSFKGRFKFDAKGRYTVNALFASGNGFGSSWSNTGAGTGEATTNLYLKQLYISARPIRGLEIQFGGLGIERGQSTEITTYDNDGYIVGQRFNLRRPEKLFFDEISVTYAYFGDLSQPNLLRRLHRLGRSNYHQFLVSKRIGDRATVSADYTFERGEETLHQAVGVNTRELRALDTVRFETYQRLNLNPGYGFALHGEKTLFRRLIIGGGYADIDRNHGGLNADGYLRGKRVFLNGKFKITPEFGISTFATRSFKNDFAVPNRTRFNAVFSYDLLVGLKRAGIL